MRNKTGLFPRLLRKFYHASALGVNQTRSGAWLTGWRCPGTNKRAERRNCFLPHMAIARFDFLLYSSSLHSAMRFCEATSYLLMQSGRSLYVSTTLDLTYSL